MKIDRVLLSLIAVLILCPLAAFGQFPTVEELTEYVKTNYTKREVMIPMRDGVKLFTAIYEPKDKAQKYPILMNRTCYTVRPYGEDQFRVVLGPNELFAKEGYIFVYQDVRGRWMSEGEFEDVRPDIDNKTPKDIDESTDTYDTIDWLIKNVANNNGRVGTYGISYPGFYTSAGAIDSHPALKAVSPQAPVSDWFHGDDIHHNGALFLAQNYSFFANFGQARPKPTSDPKSVKPFDYGTEDGYKYYLEMGSLANSDNAYRKQVGDIRFWNEMMAHPNYDKFWQDRNILPRLKNIKAAVMTVGGWYDNEDLYGSLQTYKYIEQQNPGIYNILVVGPWFHGGWERSDGEWLGTAYFGGKISRYYREKVELPFFNHFLKDKGDISNLKDINFFDTGAHKWDGYDSWSFTNAKTLYFQPGGKLSFDMPPADKAAQAMPDEYVSDPAKPVPYTQKISLNYPRDFMTEDQRFAASRPDVLVYQTEPLAADITVTGDITPVLYVSTTGTDADYVVKLIDVFPDDYKYPETGKTDADGDPERMKPPMDSAFSVFKPGGYQMLLRGEPFRARFRNSFEKPEPMTPNQITRIEFTMPAVSHTFKKGHRIMVQIQSTWFPLVDRNPQKYMPNIFDAQDGDFIKATQRVYVSGANPSRLKLMVAK
ncbi:MAG TPA: CocE/NonD family hydrolase [Pyrinomonadaceae bacterium]|jgi:putative CocE/NonD family hydrolase|nr:CocE/NonD family hydrolase [Pyrinomonadaceae bacterium]